MKCKNIYFFILFSLITSFFTSNLYSLSPKSINEEQVIWNKYKLLYDNNRDWLMAKQADKPNSVPKGAGPDVGITNEFLQSKTGRWFDKNGIWKNNFGISLVAFIPENTHLHNTLVKAQTQIGKVLGSDVWLPIQTDRIHMTIAPVDVNKDLENPRNQPLSEEVTKNYFSNLKNKIKNIKKAFNITFEKVFQSPMDGRLNVQGIPTSLRDENAILDLRTILGYKNPIIHIGLGTLKKEISSAKFMELHKIIEQNLSGVDLFGETLFEELSLVQHPNDQFADNRTKDNIVIGNISLPRNIILDSPKKAGPEKISA